jgi:hypothetical protein
MMTFLVRRRGKRPEGVHVLLGHEEVRGREVAARDRLADHAVACASASAAARGPPAIAEGRLPAALRRQDLRLLLALGPQDLRLAQALRLEHGGALLALGLHLPRHGHRQDPAAAGCP